LFVQAFHQTVSIIPSLLNFKSLSAALYPSVLKIATGSREAGTA